MNVFADESLNVTKSHLPAVDFSINDPAVEAKVRKCLEINNLIQNSRIREDVRNLIKYGDFAYTLRFYRDGEDLDSDGNSFLVESVDRKENVISRSFKPHEISISYLAPENYTLEGFRGQVFKLKAHDRVKKDYAPYEFVLFNLPSRRNFPHGESILEPGRTPFEVLSVTEQLLFMCRSSKVERLVVSYPEGFDPSTDFENMVNLRANFDNVRWMNGINNGGMTRNSDTSLNTIYFIPDSITLSSVKNNVDVSEIADVEYLRNKLIDSLGVPKSIALSSEDSGSDFRTKPLDEIDSISAKKIPFIQDAYLEGLEKLLTLLSYYFGADLDTLKVSVYIKSPSKISTKLIEDYTNGFEMVRNLMSLAREVDPNYEVSLADLKSMLSNIGLNPDIFNIPSFVAKYSSTLDSQQDDVTFGDGETADTIGTEPVSEVSTESMNKIYFKSRELLPSSYTIRESKERTSSIPISISDDLTVHPRLYDCFVHH